MTYANATTLVEFLRARYGEDEHFANEARLPAARREQLLREVKGKQRIVDMYEDACRREENPPSHDARTLAKMQRETLEVVLLLHAAAWSDHPEYREGWRPAEVTA